MFRKLLTLWLWGENELISSAIRRDLRMRNEILNGLRMALDVICRR